LFARCIKEFPSNTASTNYFGFQRTAVTLFRIERGDGVQTDHRQVISDEKETGRLEAFSDGVFAIAITLLILELKVPALISTSSLVVTPAALGKALLEQWPSYVSLITSFFTILVMWMHHHAILKNIRRTDAWLHFANGFLLFVVTFVPYPTAVLATYLNTPAAKMAAAFYAGTFVLIAFDTFCSFVRHCEGSFWQAPGRLNTWTDSGAVMLSAHPSICWLF
jgi:uncharacterized membrane protein